MTIITRVKFLILIFATLAITVACAAPRDQMPYRVWPGLPETPRVKLTNSYIGPIEFQKKTFIKGTVLGEQSKDAFFKPAAVAIDNQGRLIVTDTGWTKIWVMDSVNKTSFELKRRGGFKKPIGLTTDPQGNIYVADSVLGSVFVFSRNGGYLKEIKDVGLVRPAGLAVDAANDLLYISDVRVHKIFVLQLSTHKLLRTVGRGRGVNPEHFNFPTNLFVDKKGKLYVTDTMNARVQVFDKEGRFLLTLASSAISPECSPDPKA